MPYFTPNDVPKAEEAAGNATEVMDVISETPEPSSFTESSKVYSKNEPTELIRFSLIPRSKETIQCMLSASITQTISSVDLYSLPSDLSST